MKSKKGMPNIIFILTDDQGAWAMHCAGNDEIQTPNLDYLAEHGTRFTDFFCTSPVCSPARASILTGRIPSQHGVHDWIASGNVDRGKLSEELEKSGEFRLEDRPIGYLDGMPAYTDVLERHGYTCALSGKWHLGDSLRPQHGFSKWYTIGRGGCHYMHPDMVEDGVLHQEKRYVTDLITDHALTFLEELSAQSSPYYLGVHYTAPHSPWEEEEHPAEYIERYRSCPFDSVPEKEPHPRQIPTAPMGTGEHRKELLRGYYAAVTAMDHGVGRILDFLREKGELEKTLIFFMADNGMNMGHHGIWGKGNGTFPFNMYDTSVKVPFLVSWPAALPQGQVVTSMHSQYDFFPTLMDLLGMKEEFPSGLPGRSFRRALEGENLEGEAVVVLDEYGPNRMIRTREWKLVHRYPYGPDELYHLTEDAGEEHNLIEEEEYEGIRRLLLAELEEWFAKYVNPAMDGSREGVYGMGQVERAGVYAKGRKNYIPCKEACPPAWPDN